MFPSGPTPLFAVLEQSVLAPAADQAGRISHLWWLYLVILSTVWAIVVGLLLRGALRQSSNSTIQSTRPIQPLAQQKERWLTAAVVGGLSTTVVILVSMLFIDFFT